MNEWLAIMPEEIDRKKRPMTKLSVVPAAMTNPDNKKRTKKPARGLRGRNIRSV